MQFCRKQRCGVRVSNHLDVDACLRRFGSLQCLIKFAACLDTHRQPVAAAQGVRKLGIIPGCDMVVSDLGIFAEQPLDEIAVVVEHEHDRLQGKTSELAYLLRGELMRTVTGHQYDPLVRCRNSGAEGSWGRPTNRSPERLVMKGRGLRHPGKSKAHGCCTR